MNATFASARLTETQRRVSHHIVAADLATTAGFPGEAVEQVERGFRLLGPTGEDALRVELAGVGVRALADLVDTARGRGRHVDVNRVRLQADHLVEQVDRIVVLQHEAGIDDPALLVALAWITAERGRLDPLG